MDVSQSVMDSLSLSEDAKDSSSDESGLRFALSLLNCNPFLIAVSLASLISLNVRTSSSERSVYDEGER